MSIKFGNSIDLSDNAILNVAQDTHPNSVVTLEKLEEELNKKANISHEHQVEDVTNLELYLIHQTLDGGIL